MEEAAAEGTGRMKGMGETSRAGAGGTEEVATSAGGTADASRAKDTAGTTSGTAGAVQAESTTGRAGRTAGKVRTAGVTAGAAGAADTDRAEGGAGYRRPTWDEYFMVVADAISRRATCDRGRSGCVIAKDRQILVTGYVGSPQGLPHCDDVGHQMKKTVHEDGSVTQHCVRTVHAEQNAICQAAKRGITIDGATLYCRMTPCRTCAMLIINCGIIRVVCEKKYHAGAESEEMFRQAGVKLEYISEETEKYENQ